MSGKQFFKLTGYFLGVLLPLLGTWLGLGLLDRYASSADSAQIRVTLLAVIVPAAMFVLVWLFVTLRGRRALNSADATSTPGPQITAQMLTSPEDHAAHGEADLLYALVHAVTQLLHRVIPPQVPGRSCTVQLSYALLPGRRQLYRINTVPPKHQAAIRTALEPWLQQLPAMPCELPMAFAVYVPLHGGPSREDDFPAPFADVLASNTDVPWPQKLQQLAIQMSPAPANADDALTVLECDRLLAIAPHNLPALWLRSRLQAQLENYPAAITDLTRMIELQSDAALPLAVRAECYFFLDQFDEAERDLTAALALDGELWRARQLRAELARRRQQYDSALTDADAAVHARPDYGPFYVTRGLVHEDQGDFDRALADFNQAVQLDPEQTPPLLARARVSLKKDDRASALSDLDRIVDLTPDSVDVRRWRAGLRFERNQYQGVVEDLSQVLNHTPEDVDSWILRGRAYGSLGKQELAIEDFSQAIERSPENAEAHAWRSLSSLALDRVDEAAVDSDRALDLGRESGRLHWIRALIARHRGELDAALSECDQALEIDAELAEAHDLRGQLRAEQGESEHALQDFTAAIRHQPDSAEAWTHRAVMRLHLDQTQAALEDLDEAIRRNPDYLPALLVRAQAYEKLQKLVAAVADLDTLIAKDADCAEGFALRAQLRLRQGRPADALDDVRTWESLRPQEINAKTLEGWCRSEQRDYRGVLDLCDRLLQDETESPAIWVLRGQAHCLLEGPDAAETDFQQAISLDPDRATDIAVEQTVAESAYWREQEVYDEAITAADRGCELQPNSRGARMSRAGGRWYSRQLVDALDDVTAALEHESDDPFAHCCRGQLLAELGETDDARRELDDAITALEEYGHDRALASALSGRALVHMSTSDWAAADADLERALSLSTGSAWVQFHRGLWYHGQGQTEAALWCFRLSLILREPRLPPYKRSQAESYIARGRPQSGGATSAPTGE